VHWLVQFAGRVAGLKSPSRPIGSFLFLGPTGVGKTEMARTLAQFLFGSDKALIRFDMFGVHGEAFSVEADRLASGICGATRKVAS